MKVEENKGVYYGASEIKFGQVVTYDGDTMMRMRPIGQVEYPDGETRYDG